MWRFSNKLWQAGPLATWRNKAVTWVNLRTYRERMLVMGTTIMILVVGLYFGVWQPLNAMRAAALAEISRYETIKARLQAIEPDAINFSTRQVAPATVITAIAGEIGLTIRRLEPEGNRIRVALEEADFENVIVWLDTLESDHSLRVVSLEMDRRPAPGVVSARVMLED